MDKKGSLMAAGLLITAALMAACNPNSVPDRSEPQKWIVSFDANGASGDPPPAQSVTAGYSIRLPNEWRLKKDNATFAGWNIAPAGEGISYPAGSHYQPSSHSVLYARWATLDSVTGIWLNMAHLPLFAGTSETLTATVSLISTTIADMLNEDGFANESVAMRWSTDNDAVASVSASGIVSAKSPGEARISVASVIDGDFTDFCDITVLELPEAVEFPVSGVSLDKTSLSLKPGQSGILTAALAPGNATITELKWKADRPNVASVRNGTVTALSAGTAKITVSTLDGGHKAECSVTVSAP